MTEYVTAKEAARILDVCTQRINTKIKQGHFPNHIWCPCGHSLLIPKDDVLGVAETNGNNIRHRRNPRRQSTPPAPHNET